MLTEAARGRRHMTEEAEVSAAAEDEGMIGSAPKSSPPHSETPGNPDPSESAADSLGDGVVRLERLGRLNIGRGEPFPGVCRSPKRCSIAEIDSGSEEPESSSRSLAGCSSSIEPVKLLSPPRSQESTLGASSEVSAILVEMLAVSFLSNVLRSRMRETEKLERDLESSTPSAGAVSCPSNVPRLGVSERGGLDDDCERLECGRAVARRASDNLSAGRHSPKRSVLIQLVVPFATTYRHSSHRAQKIS
mmetsp:Transcript_2021/g.4115  ORF Transcript_2021/g.4115 Transcript_2021/m.4115 type:complete len:248 (-) Transcript_2021:4357-5100(-)